MSDSRSLSTTQRPDLDTGAPDSMEQPSLNGNGEIHALEANTSTELLDEATSGSSSSSCSSLVSQTSTIRYEQESFELYSNRVKELCHVLWPNPTQVSQAFSACSSNNFHVERLKGGTFHRIIGITINPNSNSPERLVLRIPRDAAVHTDREAAIVNFIRQYPSIPVPEIQGFRGTNANPLGSAYMIQSRVPGHDLQSSGHSWPTLTHQQKCSIATEFGKILRSLQDIQCPTPGRIDIAIRNDNNEGFLVRPFEVAQRPKNGNSIELNLDADSSASTAPKYDCVIDFFVSQFDRWRINEEPGDLGDQYLDCISSVARQMDAMGFLSDDVYCLCHLDLNQAPRNVMVNIQPDGSAKITGIIDWDSAVFGPGFVACAPPMWLWAWDSEEDEHEREAGNTPATPEQQELKHLFEDAVGPDFLKYSYGPQYRLGRTMFGLALRGKNSDYEMNEIDDIVREWATLRAPEMPLIKDPRELESEKNEAFYNELAADNEEIERKLRYVDYMESRRAEGIDDGDITDYEDWAQHR